MSRYVCRICTTLCRLLEVAVSDTDSTAIACKSVSAAKKIRRKGKIRQKMRNNTPKGMIMKLDGPIDLCGEYECSFIKEWKGEYFRLT